MAESHPLSPVGLELLDRRSFLRTTGSGLGAVALSCLLDQQGLLAAAPDSGAGADPADGNLRLATPIRPAIDPRHPLAARPPQFPAKARNVLVIYCSGACSQIDTFDYKPELVKRHGQPMPTKEKLITFQGEQGALTKSPYTFAPRGKCGKMVSNLLPRLGDLVDDMCFIHSLTSKTSTHGPGELFMSTGFSLDGFPSMGAWVSYALGTETDDLPAFVAIPDPRGVPQSSVANWGAGFLPAVFQGTAFNVQRPVGHVKLPGGVSPQADRATRDYLKLLNDRHLAQYPGDNDLAARISSYELAAQMQLSIPRVADISSEPPHVLKLYGADDPRNKLKAGFARNCILARRLVERGVRFVEIFNGSYAMGEGVGNWDGHRALKDQYDIHGPILDQPAAALLTDLKQRGLLAHTLVVWCTEFGRMPTFQKGASGRDHNPDGFTCWLAGAGVKAPFSYGATDEFSYKAVENVATVYDFHATILRIPILSNPKVFPCGHDAGIRMPA